MKLHYFTSNWKEFTQKFVTTLIFLYRPFIHSLSHTHTKLFVVFHWLMCYANISRDFHSIAFRNFRFNFFLSPYLLYDKTYITQAMAKKKQSSTIETHDWIKVFHMKPTIEFYCMWNYRRNSIEYSGNFFT